MAKTIAKRTADTILQKPQIIKLGGRTFEVAPPCCATLIEFSGLMSEVPFVDMMGDRINEMLAAAKDTDVLFKQVAILIMGAKKVNEERGWWQFWRKGSVEELARWLKYNCRPSELKEGMIRLLSMMEIESFFELTTSLQEISLIQQMRAVDDETTVSGQ